MPTKSNIAVLSDFKAGKTFWVVWLGNRELHPEPIRCMGRPYTDHISTWIPTRNEYGNSHESLGTVGVLHGHNYAGRTTFTTVRTAQRYCHEMQDTEYHLQYRKKLEDDNFDMFGLLYSGYDDHSEPEQDQMNKWLETELPATEAIKIIGRESEELSYLNRLPYTEGSSVWRQALCQVSPIKYALISRIDKYKYRIEGYLEVCDGTGSWVSDIGYLLLKGNKWYSTDCWRDNAMETPHQLLGVFPEKGIFVPAREDS